jgi:toxin ParE1/3/4
MKYHVFLAEDAENDILDIYQFIRLQDSAQKAEYVYGRLQQCCESLSDNPERGHFPPELEKIGVFDFREIHFKPYRIIYQICGLRIFIHGILDGRRDLQTILERRLLRI